MHKYRDARREVESSRKIAWVTKQASNESPMGKSMQMRVATPRPTGKIPGMGSIAKNPFNAIQKVKVPCPPSVPKIKVASQRLNDRGEPYMEELDDPTFGTKAPKNFEEMFGVDPQFKSRKEQNARKRKVIRSELHDARLYSNLAGMLTSREARVARHKRLKKYKHDTKLEAMREGLFPTGEKTAGYSHDYYMRNRQKIKQRNREYRMRNAAKLRIARQRYAREIKSGARRKAKRIRSGTQYITYGGF